MWDEGLYLPNSQKNLVIVYVQYFSREKNGNEQKEAGFGPFKKQKQI